MSAQRPWVGGYGPEHSAHGRFTNDRCLDARDGISAACRAHHKHWGAVTPNAAYASLVKEKGCTLISPTSDMTLFSARLAVMKEQFSQLRTVR